jgi:hypothetical protein
MPRGASGRFVVHHQTRAVAALAVAGLLTLALHRSAPIAVDPAACTSTLEVALPGVLRLFPDLAIGTAIAWTNAVIVFTALTVFGRLVQAGTDSMAVAAAITATVALSPTFELPLAPSRPAAVFAAVSCALYAVARPEHRRSTDARTGPDTFAGVAIFAAAALPLVAPGLLVPALMLAACALLHRRRRLNWVRAAGIALPVMLLSVCVLSVAGTAWNEGPSPATVTAGLACAWPRPREWFPTILVSLVGAISRIGPLPFGLALLGLYVHARRRAVPAGWWSLALVASPVLVGDPGLIGPETLTPLAVGLWYFVACGTAAAIDTATPRERAPIAVALLLLVPWLQIQHQLAVGSLQPPTTLGHGSLSLRQFWRLARALPAGALVQEDASTDLLLRAAVSRIERSNKPLRVIARDPDLVKRAAVLGPVFALPRSQLWLQKRGLRFSVEDQDLPGVARYKSARSCALLRSDWTDLPELLAAPGLALVASQPDDLGPAAIYYGADQPIQGTTSSWPGSSTRGFQVRLYDRNRIPDLAERLKAQGIEPSSALLNTPYVLRVVMWRTAGGPESLAVAIDGAVRVAVARGEPGGSWRSLLLCPAFDEKASPIRPLD